jgi:hypothetical protein
MDCSRQTVGWIAWQFRDLFIQYDPSIVDIPSDVPVHPVASEGIRIICPQAAVSLCVAGTAASSGTCAGVLCVVVAAVPYHVRASWSVGSVVSRVEEPYNIRLLCGGWGA